MQIIKTETYIKLIADEGKEIIKRGYSDIFHTTMALVPPDTDLNQYLEVSAENIEPEVVEDIPSAVLDDLDDDIIAMQEYLVALSKSKLQEFLEANPIQLDLIGVRRYYSVTQESQSQLNSLIQATEDAMNLNINFTPTWNDIYGMREPWTLENLKKLRIAIQEYIIQFINQQQEMEKRILNTITAEALLQIDIHYSVKNN